LNASPDSRRQIIGHVIPDYRHATWRPASGGWRRRTFGKALPRNPAQSISGLGFPNALDHSFTEIRLYSVVDKAGEQSAAKENTEYRDRPRRGGAVDRIPPIVSYGLISSA
jgi:hypothetical protein